MSTTRRKFLQSSAVVAGVVVAPAIMAAPKHASDKRLMLKADNNNVAITIYSDGSVRRHYLEITSVSIVENPVNPAARIQL